MKSSNIVMAGAIACISLIIILVAAMWVLSPYGAPTLDSADLVLNTAVKTTGAANIVCSVVLDIRGYDTLGEATLLFAAVTGVVVLLANKEEKKEQK